MLVTTVAHIFEEIWGWFWIFEILGLKWFLILIWFLLFIPFIIFYFILLEKRWAYQPGIVYAGFMDIQGIGHNLGFLLMESYYGGFAGGVIGVVLTCLSIPLIYYILKTIPSSKTIRI
ncbi:MAG: hypothetical protein ACFFB2_18915 [Promethearchaeota archaeon]